MEKGIFYVLKDGHCLGKFDDKDSALSYAKLIGGKVYDYNENKQIK